MGEGMADSMYTQGEKATTEVAVAVSPQDRRRRRRRRSVRDAGSTRQEKSPPFYSADEHIQYNVLRFLNNRELYAGPLRASRSLRRVAAFAVDPTAKIPDGGAPPRALTALELMSGLGNADSVRMLLRDPRVDPTANRNGALAHAVANHQAKIVRMLVDDGRTGFASDFYPERPDIGIIMQAIIGADGPIRHSGDAAVFDELLRSEKVREHLAEEPMILPDAIGSGPTDVVRLLLEDGSVDPLVHDKKSITRAILRESDDELRLLLDDGRIDPSAHDNDALKTAMQRDEASKVVMLYDSGRVDPEGLLTWAVDVNRVRYGGARYPIDRVGLVRRLLADPRVDPAADNNAALRVVLWDDGVIYDRHGSVDNRRMWERRTIRDMLLADSRIDPAARDSELLREAAAEGVLSAVRILIEDGRADPMANEGEALIAAVSAGGGPHDECIVETLLRDPRVDPMARNGEALRIAQAKGRTAIAEMIQQHVRGESPGSRSSERLKVAKSASAAADTTTTTTTTPYAMLADAVLGDDDDALRAILRHLNNRELYEGPLRASRRLRRVAARTLGTPDAHARAHHPGGALLAASQRGDASLVLELLQGGRVGDADAERALQVAQRAGHGRVARMLGRHLRRSGRPSMRRARQSRSDALLLLLRAATTSERGSDALRRILAQVPRDDTSAATTRAFSRALFGAVYHMDADRVELLLRDGRADPAAHRSAALFEATNDMNPRWRAGVAVRILRLLLRDGRADPMARGRGGVDALLAWVDTQRSLRAAERAELAGLLRRAVRDVVADAADTGGRRAAAAIGSRARPAVRRRGAPLAALAAGSDNLLLAMVLQFLNNAELYAGPLRAAVRTYELARHALDPAEDSSQALVRACAAGLDDVVRRLLDDGRADPAARDGAPIGLASQAGHARIVEMLLRDGRAAAQQAHLDWALIAASEHGRARVVEVLLLTTTTTRNDSGGSRADPAARDHWAIRSAAARGHADVVALLLGDTRTDAAAVAAATAEAIEATHDAAALALLRDPRADPAGAIALLLDDGVLIASERPMDGTVRHLVETGALAFDDRDAAATYAVLMHAIAMADVALVDFAIAHGANPAVGGSEMVAIASTVGDEAIVARLIADERVDPGARSNEALGEAIAGGHMGVVRELLLHPDVRRRVPGGSAEVDEALAGVTHRSSDDDVARLVDLLQQLPNPPRAEAVDGPAAATEKSGK